MRPIFQNLPTALYVDLLSHLVAKHNGDLVIPRVHALQRVGSSNRSVETFGDFLLS